MTSTRHQHSGVEDAARAADLIAEFHARREAWQRQGQEVARLRAALRASADREAAVIVAAADASIRAILDDTKRKLILITAQLDVVASRTDSPSRQAATPPPPIARVPAPIESVQPSSFVPPPAPVAERAVIADAVELRPPVNSAKEFRRPLKFWAAAGLLIAAVLCAAGGWWFFAGTAPVRTTASIPASAPVVPAPAGRKDPDAAAIQPARSPAPPSSPTPSPLSLVINARGDAWIRSTIDGGAARSRLLKAGEVMQVAASRDIAIVVGDAGAVALSLNGGEATTLGRKGQVVTRRFTSADAETSARIEVAAAAERWLNAYYRQDATRMRAIAVPNVGVLDQRRSNERLPPGFEEVRRTLDDVKFEQRGDTAILAGSVAERSLAGAEVVQRRFLIFQNWVRRSDQWRLAGARIVADSR